MAGLPLGGVNMPSTVYLIELMTQEAEEWVNENLALEPWQWLGGNIGIEHRFVENILYGMTDDGLILGEDFRVDI